MTSTFYITCPCGCGNAVLATDEGFTATTVTVAACEESAAFGVDSTRMRKSAAYAAAVPAPAALSHRTGLVALG